ncbi:MAG: 4-alpha-glucanotransferase [Tannerella sp.]|nr:4-alpha-glucanotransferase [Tannerella sp.]
MDKQAVQTMKVTFYINYWTAAGQKLYIAGSVPELGDGQAGMAKEMSYSGGGYWTLQTDISPSVEEIGYRYILVNADGSSEVEPSGQKHRVTFDASQPVYILYDYWQLTPPQIALYTSAFTKNRFARESRKPQTGGRSNRTILIRVPNPRVERNQELYLAGNQDCLGFWAPEQSKKMCAVDFPDWEIRLNADEVTFPLEYKFLVRDKAGLLCHWEKGANRLLTHIPQEENETVVVTDFPYRDSLPAWKGAGTVIPVFSLRSEQSFGIGDMYDLKLLIDWAEQTHQCLIQVLPMNDTTRTHTWADSYPYSAISIYALHPVYISLQEMGALNNPEKADFYRRIQQTLNAGESVDYEGVEKYKTLYCRDFFAQEGEKILKSAAFKSFWRANKIWLLPYAAFCYYRDRYHTADFSQWGENAVYRSSRVQSLCRKGHEAYPEIMFTCFLQFVIHTQFKAASDYARSKGVILKGDLPIGVHRTSLETWTEASYFNCDEQAGAPPDVFSTIGQNWSFPTYNWDVMEKDRYSWWKKRFHKLEDYFDAFRIDHILGFFRIWEIPVDYVQGLCGHFRPALPFSVEEIERYGVKWDERFVTPQLSSRFLKDLFGDGTESVIKDYLTPVANEYVILKPFCDTQRKIEALFAERTDDASVKIKEGLFAIANEVLFLEDPYETAKYHPRISGARSYAYQSLLTEDERLSYNTLSDYFFYERHHDFWKAEALKRLTPLIAGTKMLTCGEDLGMIPDSVHEVMDGLHLLSLELERAPKTFGIDFADLQSLPYLSVCTTSTHDMNPLRNWWTEDAEQTQHYCQSVLRIAGNAPDECSPELAEQILFNHLKASSMLTIIPLQDWLAMSGELRRTDYEQERINIPANPHHYWRYRMHISLEKLLHATGFNRKICAMLFHSGR